jgi:hypothetical protein
VFGFLLAHGSSAVVAFRLRREREPARVAALLDLSSSSLALLTYSQKRKGIAPGPQAAPEEIDAVLRSPRPFFVAAIGGAGLLAILWLMMFKPF